ncbi:MAG: nitroreductase family protein [Candidatus Marinimicrobia bacterium]|jgi:nitroreductase|nr:nitroreductase family protein [Candidatus Neomarinimicrobiota bacterium]MBT7822303.1 nitroreductase family protein [Candidatus Neomarinimicrobiota bacterium]
MAFQKLHYNQLSETKMVRESELFLERFNQRRTIRDFSDKSFPVEIIQNAIKTASSAPSGANKQPWHFVIVKDSAVKKEIRIAAEKEEKEFYEHRASEEWLEDLNQFETDWHKPFLEIAPYLIVVFKQNYDLGSDGKRKNYYVNESVGIASGFLLVALHNAGLATLTHTPSPMGFLEKILKRPENEKAVLLIPVGYPAEDAKVPDLKKKSFEDISTTI